MDPSNVQGHSRTDGFSVDSPKDAVVALFLRQALRGLAIIIVVGLAVLIPLFAVNKRDGSIAMGVAALFMLLPSAILFRMGRIREATWVFLTAGIIIVTVIVAFSGGTHGQPIQLGISVIAMVLISRRAAVVFASASLLADLGMLIFQSMGGHLPRIFPFPPSGSWFNLLLTFVLVLPTVDRAMSQLRESERRFRDAFRLSPEGIVIATRDGRFLEANDAFLQMSEYSRPEVIGNHWTQMHMWKTEEGCSGFFAKLAGDEPVRGYEAELKTRTGGLRYVQISAERVRLQEADCILAIIRDVTQQRLLEQRLHRAQRMEALGRMADGVVHRFKSLLATISGSAEILQTLVSGPAANEQLTRICDTTDTAVSLTKQLLAFTRQQILRPRLLDLNVVVEVLWNMTPRLQRPNVEATLLLQDDLGKINADCGQIEQVIMSLAANAEDAMPEGGKLTIKTADVELDTPFIVEHGGTTRTDAYVMLAITDTGVGMSSAVQEHIFEPFFSTKDARGESGLGLAAAYGIVEQSGGFIAVDSEPGRGSTFAVYLPRIDHNGHHPSVTAA